MRPFTEKEREVIDRDLRRSGRDLFASLGWKKTGIDDLCRAAGIARGTFYLFYPSKEAFLLALLAEAEQAVKAELLEQLAEAPDGASALRGLLDSTLGVIDRHPLLRFAFADPQEPAPWLRALEGESVEVLVSGDDETAAVVLEKLRAHGLALTVTPTVLAGLLRALVLLPLQRRVVGPVFDEVVGTLASALTRGLV